MFDLFAIMRSAATAAGPDGAVLAAGYELPRSVARMAADEGLIAGYVSEVRPDPRAMDPLVAGWWIDRPG